MDQMRLLVALVLSFLVFMLWNVFSARRPNSARRRSFNRMRGWKRKISRRPPPPHRKSAPLPSATKPAPQRPARRITVETPLYKVGLTEKGASINSFVLKRYRVAVRRIPPCRICSPKTVP